MKKIAFILVIVFISSCNEKENISYEEDGLKVVGQLIHGKKEGIFTHYFSNNAIQSIFYFENDTVAIHTIFNENGDTIFQFKRSIMYDFAKVDTKTKITAIFKLNYKQRLYEGVFFDSTTHIQMINSDLSFLTRSDSLRLSRDYPDWETQVREWKYGKTTP